MLPINHELVTSAKLRLVSVFPDIDKDYPKIRNLPKIFLISFANVAPDAKKRDHITDALISLHWLRVPERIVFKVTVQTYRALHGDAPQYLRQFTPVADILS